MKIIRIYILWVALLLTSLPVQAKENILNLDELLKQAVSNNPEIRELNNRLEATKLKEGQETSLEDPMLGVGIMNVPTNIPAFGPEDMTSGEISISQKIPYPEKLGLKGRMVRAMVETDKAMLQAKTNEIKREIKRDYYEIFLINKNIEITRKNKELLKELVKVAETKYIVNQGTQQEIIRTNVEQSELTKKLLELEQQKNSLLVRLKFHLGNPTQNLSGNTAELNLRKLASPANKIIEYALKNNPEIQAVNNNINFRKLENEMAKLEYIPDLDFMLAYGLKPNRADMISGRVTINLPAWYKTKQKNRVKETEFNTRAEEDNLNYRKNEVITGINQAILMVENREKLYNLLIGGIIPQAEQNLKSALSGYQVGKIDFFALLESQRMLLDYQLDVYMNITEHEKALAELEYMAGRELVKSER